MAEYTQNFNLIKPGQEEFYNVETFNNNADIIDAELKNLKNTIENLNADGITLPDGKTISEKFEEIETEIGNIEELDTDTKSNIIAAINEIYQEIVAHKAENVQDDDTHGVKSYVNSYGLGTGAKYIADCNELSIIGDTGFYMVDANTLNIPYATFNGTLIHIGRGSRPTQIAQSYSDNRMFIRGYRSDIYGWNDWAEVISDGNLIQTTEVNDSTKVPSSAVTYALQQWINSRFQLVTGDVLAWALTCDEGITSFYAAEPVSNLPNQNPAYTLGFVLKSSGTASHIFIIDRLNGKIYKNTYVTSSQAWLGWQEINMTAV